MFTVELIYDVGCPNVKQARKVLLQAFAHTRLPAKWLEWDRSAPESPSYVRSYGSPTILVDSRDIANASPSDGADCCRLYANTGGELSGAPSASTIASAFLKAMDRARE